MKNKYIDSFNLFVNESNDYKFEYQLLSRLQQDCDYFLNNGQGSEKQLWAGNVVDQITKMKELWELLPEKPEWLSYDEILKYEDKMLNYNN